MVLAHFSQMLSANFLDPYVTYMFHFFWVILTTIHELL